MTILPVQRTVSPAAPVGSPEETGAPGAAPERLGRRRSGHGTDAVAALTPYLFLVFFIPAGLVFPALGGVGTPANIYALVVLLWYVAARLMGRLIPAARTRIPRVAIVLFGTSVMLSYIADGMRSTTTQEIQAADRAVIELIAWIGLVVVTTSGIRDYERLRQLLRRIVVCGSILSLMGMIEFFTRSSVAAYIKIPGLHPAVDTVATMTRGGFTRPMATASQPLEFGGLLAVLLPFAIQQAFDPATGGRLKRWLPVALIGGVLPLTVSRTAVLGLAVVLLIILPTWKARRRWPAIGVILVGFGATKAAVPGLLGTISKSFSSFLGGTDNSTTARTGDYSGVAPYVHSSPWFGRGLGTFIPSLYRYTDNMYLHALVEVGIVGTVAMSCLFFAGMYCGGAGRRAFPDGPERELGWSFVAACAVAAVSSATFDTLSFPMFSGVFFLILGMSGAYLGIAQRARSARGPGERAGSAPAAQP